MTGLIDQAILYAVESMQLRRILGNFHIVGFKLDKGHIKHFLRFQRFSADLEVVFASEKLYQPLFSVYDQLL